MDSSKVAAVEDYDSVIQEAIPTSRREAFKKRASGLASVTNSSDTGTIDSGYSSNSTANIAGELFPESPTRPENQGDLSHSEEPALSRSSLSQSTSKQDGRTRPSGHPHRISGSYSYGPGTLPTYRPASRAASKPNNRDGRASPAVRCPPPINTGPGGGDECDCKGCNVTSAARPSSMLSPTSAGLESSWAFDLRNGLPYVSNGMNSWTPLSTSPGPSRGLDGSKNGFPFDTFTTPDPTNPSGSLGSSHSLNYGSSSNPLVNPLPGWSQYDYTASPAAYTPTSVNPLHSPPPYLGSGSSSSWLPPPTPGGLGLQGQDGGIDYDYNATQGYLYGNGSGAMSANNGLPGSYNLPPRSASVQPTGSTRRPRSNTYHNRERPDIPDFSAMPPPQPSSHRRSGSRNPAGKKPHQPTNSYDSGYEPYDVNNYDLAYNPTFDEFAPPPPPNRRLSRSGATPPGPYPDIARATSVPPVENYVTNMEKARRTSSMTPQPLAITQRERERNRRGSNSSSGLSAARRVHDSQLDQLVEQIVVEKRPDLAVTKRSSNSNRHEHAELSYSTEGYEGYEGYPSYDGYGQEYAPYENSYEGAGMDLGAHEQGMVLRGDMNSDPYAVRYPGVGISSKLPASASNDPYHRPARMNVERRKSMHRRNSDFPHSKDPLASGAELELMRTGSVSRGSGADRRTRRQIEYDLGGSYY